MVGEILVEMGDALVEAGYAENEWTESYDESHVLDSLIRLSRKLGKYPAKAEMMLERRGDVTFPCHNPIPRLGNKNELMRKPTAYCESHEGNGDVVRILRETPVTTQVKVSVTTDDKLQLGYVYLLLPAGTRLASQKPPSTARA